MEDPRNSQFQAFFGILGIIAMFIGGAAYAAQAASWQAVLACVGAASCLFGLFCGWEG